MSEAALAGRWLVPLPALVVSADERAAIRFLGFFVSAIRSPNTRRAYAHAVSEFIAWCAEAGVGSVTAVQPVHAAAWIEPQKQTLSAPTGTAMGAPVGKGRQAPHDAVSPHA
jgi:hypothetical protein